MKSLIPICTGLVSFALLACSESNPVGPLPGSSSTPQSSSNIPMSSSSILFPSSSVDNSSSSIVISSSSNPGPSETSNLWTADDGTQVATGGYWFGYDDASDGGHSTWSCGGIQGAKGDDFAFCMREADGAAEIDFNVSADIPNGAFDPFGFAGVGFNLGEDNGGVKTPVDLSGYSGMTIEYESNQKFFMQLVYDEKILKYDVHKVTLPKSQTSATFTFDQFKQEGWGDAGNLSENLDKVTEIKFQAHSSNFTGGGQLVIKKITLNK